MKNRKLLSHVCVAAVVTSVIATNIMEPVAAGSYTTGILVPDLKALGIKTNGKTTAQVMEEQVVKNALSISDYDVEETIHISTADDFIEFARLCTTDMASAKKLIVLDNDIDLKGKDFAPVPVFAGIFDGQNHRISGVVYHGNEGMCGLFRYLVADGVIENLKVSSYMTTDANVTNLGGICGVNEGYIYNCSYSGSVLGYSQVGGIAGLNAGSGTISNCQTQGFAQGSYYTGGIVGYSNGVISNCKNTSSINSDSNWVAGDDQDGLDWLTEMMDSEEKRTESGVDAGGIAGYSRGIIIDCSNYGIVGYEHAGYNIGGIAGRQSGYMSQCVNSGIVRGRKDVGGIVGQMEPYLQLDEEESLSVAIDELHDLIDIALVDMEKESDVMSYDLKDLNNHANTVFDLGKTVADQTKEVAQSAIDNVRTISNRADYVVDKTPGITDEIKDATSDLKQFMKDADVGNYMSEADKNRLDDKEKEISESNENIVDAEALRALNKKNSDYDDHKSMPDTDDYPPLTQEESDERDRLIDKLKDKGVVDPTKNVQLVTFIDEQRKIITDDSQDCITILRPAVRQAADTAPESGVKAMEHFENAVSQTKDVANYLSAQDDLVWKNFDESYSENMTAIYNETRTISNILDRLNANTNANTDTVLEDYRDINDQVNKILNLFNGKIDAINEDAAAELYKDISDKSIDECVTGKVENCKNTIGVSGDINIGGIAGNMEIDEEDPEDNAAGGKKISTNTYLSSCILANSENVAGVTAKKNGAGGVVGYMGLGAVYKCKNSGMVESTEGGYVGGVCGQSEGIIRNCDAICAISGTTYAGGIAGEGNEVKDCRSMVTITDCDSYMGAICGDIKKDSLADLATGLKKVENNYYIDNGIGGINGISYDYYAKPVGYDEIADNEEFSADYNKVAVTFVADGKTVKTLYYDYGVYANQIQMPDVPAKDEEYGVWKEIPTVRLESNYVVEAEYLPYETILKSPEMVDGKEVAFVEGKFTDKSIFECATTKADDVCKNGIMYRIVVENGVAAVNETPTYTIRLLNQAGDKAEVYQSINGQWQKVDFKIRGSYIQVDNVPSNSQFVIGVKKNIFGR